MKTLVYVGAYVGDSLIGMVHNYDKIFAFEPDINSFKILSDRIGNNPKVSLINAACAESDGESDFYVLPCKAASSMSKPGKDFIKHCEEFGSLGHIETSDPIKVKTINLYNFLKKNGVDYIDSYISDCQGYDFTILKTLLPYIEESNIGELYIETHGDNKVAYENLVNNISSFKKILSKKYTIDYISMGRLNGKIVKNEEEMKKYQKDDSSELEFDVKWIKV